MAEAVHGTEGICGSGGKGEKRKMFSHREHGFPTQGRRRKIKGLALRKCRNLANGLLQVSLGPTRPMMIWNRRRLLPSEDFSLINAANFLEAPFWSASLLRAIRFGQ